MKRRALAYFLATVVAVPVLAGGGTLVRLDGWIVDSYCGAKNVNVEATDDTLACVKKGAKLILITADGTSYALENQELALKHIGREVHVFGMVDKNRNLKIGNYLSEESLTNPGVEPQEEGLVGRKLRPAERERPPEPAESPDAPKPSKKGC